MYDIIIIGAGPAGLTSAIYARRSNKTVLVLEAKTYGGQIVTTDKIDNYPAAPHISGYDFATNLYNQVIELGAEVKFEKAIDIDGKKVITEKNEYEAKAIIIAIGVRNRKLNIPGEDKFEGKGISYCATCDGAFYKGKTVAVIGAGNTAFSEAIYLSDIAKKVYVIHRNEKFKASYYLTKKLKSKENVEFILNTNVIKINGKDKITDVDIKDNEDNVSNLKIDGLFIAIGQIPENNNLTKDLKIDENGYIMTDENLQSNKKGIYVAGDIRPKSLRQLVTATSDGAIAAVNAIKNIK
ncbi:MAG: thioredoxin-disulfide reductase [Bacilli bacterium]|nr:thioredoxin-disulfide reductase [Bacilli bacterium]MBO6195563.1 thioredoxin-disulfide reductase [Bacilli bacterium]